MQGIWQIYFISAIAIVFTVWSLGFVLVFRDAAGRMLKRASEIEAIFPDSSERRESKLFLLLNDWYNNAKGFSALKLLFWSTVVFYCLLRARFHFLCRNHTTNTQIWPLTGGSAKFRLAKGCVSADALARSGWDFYRASMACAPRGSSLGSPCDRTVNGKISRT